MSRGKRTCGPGLLQRLVRRLALPVWAGSCASRPRTQPRYRDDDRDTRDHVGGQRAGVEPLEPAMVPERERPRAPGPLEEPLERTAVPRQVGERPHGSEDRKPDQESPASPHRSPPPPNDQAHLPRPALRPGSGAAIGSASALHERDRPLVLPGDRAQLQEGLEQILAVDVVEAVIERLGPRAVFGRMLERPLRLHRR
jgi:hypothetical protein